MNQFTDKHQKQLPPTSELGLQSSSKVENSSLSAQTSKLNLSVKVPQKIPGPKLNSIQVKSDPSAVAEPGQMTDMDLVNAVTHIIKSATVHPLGSSSANRELKNQKANLEQNKESRTKAADQAAKNQQIIEQDKIQQKNVIERANTKDGPGHGRRELKADIRAEKVIKTGIARHDAITDHAPIRQAIKDLQKFTREHARSQSSVTANSSALASRNKSIEGEKEGLTRDLVRGTSSRKHEKNENNVDAISLDQYSSQVKAAIETRIEATQWFRTETRPEMKQELQQEIKQEIRAAELKAMEIQRQFIHAASIQSNHRGDTLHHEIEEDFFESWVFKDEQLRLAKRRKPSKQLLASQAKRALRRMTPLEKRKARLKREKIRKMRKWARRKNRRFIFR